MSMIEWTIPDGYWYLKYINRQINDWDGKKLVVEHGCLICCGYVEIVDMVGSAMVKGDDDCLVGTGWK